MIFGRKQSNKPEVGQDVLTNDKECIGDVSAVQDDYLEVRGGTIDRPMVWRVPREAISKVDDNGVHLNVSRGQAIAKGWETPATTGGSEATSANA